MMTKIPMMIMMTLPNAKYPYYKQVAQLISIATVNIGGGVFFQAGVLYSVENAKFWPIWAFCFCEFTHFLVYYYRAEY